MRKLATVTNLVALNILWLICCLPLITVGAATSAMYYTVFGYLTEDGDEILRPFFRSFRNNFRQSLMLWLPQALVMAVLFLDGVFLAANGGNGAAWFLLAGIVTVVCGVNAYVYPMLARFEMENKAILRSSFSLFLLHIPSTLIMVALNTMPAALMVFAPRTFARWSLLWVGLWFSMTAFINAKMLLRLWEKHLPA